MKIKFEKQPCYKGVYYLWRSENDHITISITSFDPRTTFVYPTKRDIEEYDKYKFEIDVDWDPEFKYRNDENPLFYARVGKYCVSIEEALSAIPKLLEDLSEKIREDIEEVARITKGRLEKSELSEHQFLDSIHHVDVLGI